MRLNDTSRRLREDRQLRQGGMGLAREVDDACVTDRGTEGTQTSAGGPRGGAGEAVRGMRDAARAGAGRGAGGLRDAVRGAQ